MAESAFGCRDRDAQVVGCRRLSRLIVRLQGFGSWIVERAHASMLQLRTDGSLLKRTTAEVPDIPEVLLYPLKLD